jgi:hypothetical protein
MKKGTGSIKNLILLIVVSGVACVRLNAQDNPPRIEIGAVLNSGKFEEFGDYRFGGGARFTFNATRLFGYEVEFTRQPTGNEPYLEPELRTGLAMKGTYRAEQKRWLRFAGLNFFGLVGPTFLRRTTYVADPNPPALCFRCTVPRRVTTPMLEFGGGIEIVPAHAVALRVEAAHGSFNELTAFSVFPSEGSRTYLKLSVAWRTWSRR